MTWNHENSAGQDFRGTRIDAGAANTIVSIFSLSIAVRLRSGAALHVTRQLSLKRDDRETGAEKVHGRVSS